jgi:hypothetical protein
MANGFLSCYWDTDPAPGMQRAAGPPWSVVVVGWPLAALALAAAAAAASGHCCCAGVWSGPLLIVRCAALRTAV